MYTGGAWPRDPPPARLAGGSGRLDVSCGSVRLEKSVPEIELVRIAKDALSIKVVALVALLRAHVSRHPPSDAERILASKIASSPAGNEGGAHVPTAAVDAIRTVNPRLTPAREGGFA